MDHEEDAGRIFAAERRGVETGVLRNAAAAAETLDQNARWLEAGGESSGAECQTGRKR